MSTANSYPNYSEQLNKTTVLRSSYLDNICGIFILFIVFFYHLPVFCGINNSSFFICIRNVLDCFMAWFFFKSGMFAIKRPFKEEFIKCWRRLLKPFLIINAFCIILHIIFYGGGEDNIIPILKVSIYRESDYLCTPLWFCLSLSIVKLLYQAIANLSEKKKWIFLCLSVSISYLLYLYAYKSNGIQEVFSISLPFWFGNLFLGLFFYILGDLLRTKQFYPVIFIIALFVYSIHFLFPFYLDFHINNSDFYFLSVFFYISGVVVFNNIFKRWLDIRIPLLTHIGENSMIYYVTHYTFIYLLLVGHSDRITGWSLYIVSFILTIIFLICIDFLFRKKLRWLIGQ